MLGKRLLAVAVICVAMAAAPMAGANHDDTTADGTRCDTWSRAGHGHSHQSGSDIVLPAAGGRIHSTSGHHQAAADPGYLEVVGGQSYRGPDPAGNDFPGQGGYVQGELDAGSGAPDADFNVAFFGPNFDAPVSEITGDPSGWAQGSYGKVCVNVAGTQVSQQTRNP